MIKKIWFLLILFSVLLINSVLGYDITVWNNTYYPNGGAQLSWVSGSAPINTHIVKISLRLSCQTSCPVERYLYLITNDTYYKSINNVSIAYTDIGAGDYGPYYTFYFNDSLPFLQKGETVNLSMLYPLTTDTQVWYIVTPNDNDSWYFTYIDGTNIPYTVYTTEECFNNPFAGCNISQDTTFNFSNSPYDFKGYSPAIRITNSSLVLNCNNSTIICNSTSDSSPKCLEFISNIENVTVKNCIFDYKAYKESTIIKGDLNKNINITNNSFLNTSFYDDEWDYGYCISFARGDNILFKNNTCYGRVHYTDTNNSYILNNSIYGQINIEESSNDIYMKHNYFNYYIVPNGDTIESGVNFELMTSNQVLQDMWLENTYGGNYSVSFGSSTGDGTLRNITIRNNKFDYFYHIFLFVETGFTNFEDVYIYNNSFSGAIDLTADYGIPGGNVIIAPDIVMFANYDIDNLQIYNNTMDGGIYLDCSNYGQQITGVSIFNNSIITSNAVFYGTYFNNIENSSIKENIIKYSNNSVVINNGVNINITDNTIYNASNRAIRIINSHDINISKNNVYNANFVIHVHTGNNYNITISYNNATNSSQLAYLENTNYSIISNNRFISPIKFTEDIKCFALAWAYNITIDNNYCDFNFIGYPTYNSFSTFIQAETDINNLTIKNNNLFNLGNETNNNGNNWFDGITINNANNVLIQDNEIKNVTGKAIQIKNSNTAILTDNIAQNSYGLYAENSPYINFSNNRVYDSNIFGGIGINCYKSNDCYILNNTIYNMEFGITFSGSNNGIAKFNNISNLSSSSTAYGVWAGNYANNSVIVNNTFDMEDDMLAFFNGNNNTLTNNTFKRYNCTQYGYINDTGSNNQYTDQICENYNLTRPQITFALTSGLSFNVYYKKNLTITWNESTNISHPVSYRIEYKKGSSYTPLFNGFRHGNYTWTSLNALPLTTYSIRVQAYTHGSGEIETSMWSESQPFSLYLQAPSGGGGAATPEPEPVDTLTIEELLDNEYFELVPPEYLPQPEQTKLCEQGCPDRCFKNVLYTNGICVNGKCEYAQQQCQTDCQAGRCVTCLKQCNDKCVGNWLYYDGYCQDDVCIYKVRECGWRCEERKLEGDWYERGRCICKNVGEFASDSRECCSGVMYQGKCIDSARKVQYSVYPENFNIKTIPYDVEIRTIKIINKENSPIYVEFEVPDLFKDYLEVPDGIFTLFPRSEQSFDLKFNAPAKYHIEKRFDLIVRTEMDGIKTTSEIPVKIEAVKGKELGEQCDRNEECLSLACFNNKCGTRIVKIVEEKRTGFFILGVLVLLILIVGYFVFFKK